MFRTLILMGALGAMASGCTTIRTVSASGMTSDSLYVAYWEGDCKPILGCGVGDGKVQHCVIADDNSLTCTEQTEVSALLSRSNKD